MRLVVALAACFGLATVVAGCSSVDGDYLRDGIGTNLGTPDLPQVSYLQDVYVGEICRQAGLRVLQQGDVLVCDEVGMRPGEWATFVQAGMNDIDRRCDAYLAWLDNKRRWREPLLAQLHSTAAATAAILGLTKVGAVPIAIVATSFGFAQESFINFQSRLITQVDQSVVQVVVLGHQNEFRRQVATVPVDNRPAAAYLLRNYLRICMPFSIEMSINNTITTLHRSGPEALRTEPMLTRAPAVAARVASGIRTAAIPSTPQDTPRGRGFVQEPPHMAFSQILDPYRPRSHDEQYVRSLLGALCVPAQEINALINQDRVSEIIVAHIAIFEDEYQPTRTNQKRKNGKLDDDEASTIRGTGSSCLAGAQNYFEKTKYANTAIGKRALEALMDSLKLDKGTTLEGARGAIEMARADPKIKPSLTLPLSMQKQVTRDLVQALP
jgi:hypothetical protein